MRMLPMLPGVALAPTTATERGRKMGSREWRKGVMRFPSQPLAALRAFCFVAIHVPWGGWPGLESSEAPDFPRQDRIRQVLTVRRGFAKPQPRPPQSQDVDRARRLGIDGA